MVDLNEIATFERVMELFSEPYDEKSELTISKQKTGYDPNIVIKIQQVNKETIKLLNKPKDFHYEMEWFKWKFIITQLSLILFL